VNAEPRPEGLRCLIVDDSPRFLTSASGLLESQGLEIVGTATNGEDALELAGSLQPDVALVDVVLGDENGIVLADLLVARVPATVVVLVSSHDREDFGDLIEKSAAAGFIPKRSLSAVAISALLGSP
jgi:DNA-binding NarL/FixJ family response regulator